MITLEEIQKVAALSKLRLNEEKTQVLYRELKNIITMIDELSKVDCTNIEPLVSVLDMHQRFREDEVKIADISTKILSNAPGKDARLAKEIKCFIVPKVVE